MYIPYGRQSINEQDIEAVVEVLRSDFLTTGPKVEEFEQAVAIRTGAKYAVAIANGTAALHAACFAAGIQKGDEVITSAITFAASANCVLYCGGIPVFADIDPNTYNISVDDIERKITKRTKAIIPVHFAGQPCAMDRIHEIADKHHLIVIEDAAHALGAEYKGKEIGGLSDMTILSFHPVKHITTGEGGMILTNNKELYEKLILFRSHGITRNPSLLSKQEGGWYYEQQELGYNYRITDIQCALGISQLRRLDPFIEKRQKLVQKYDEAFFDKKGIKTQMILPECRSSWHLYVIQVAERDKMFEELTSAGIGVNVHYIPVYKHPYYQSNGFSSVHCENAENYYRHALSLPLFQNLSEEEQEYVIQHVYDSNGNTL